MADVEVTGLRELLADLTRAESASVPEVMKVVSKGALQIKKDWARRWSGHAHIPALPAAISYDLFPLPGSIRAEVGPDKGKPQGPLGNLVEFGSKNNAPIPGGMPAIDAEAPRFERSLADLGAKLLEGR